MLAVSTFSRTVFALVILSLTAAVWGAKNTYIVTRVNEAFCGSETVIWHKYGIVKHMLEANDSCELKLKWRSDVPRLFLQFDLKEPCLRNPGVVMVRNSNAENFTDLYVENSTTTRRMIHTVSNQVHVKVDTSSDCLGLQTSLGYLMRYNLVGNVAAVNQTNKECSGRFHCKNDFCIDMLLKCDGVDNCGDRSDEDILLCLDFGSIINNLNSWTVAPFQPPSIDFGDDDYYVTTTPSRTVVAIIVVAVVLLVIGIGAACVRHHRYSTVTTRVVNHPYPGHSGVQVSYPMAVSAPNYPTVSGVNTSVYQPSAYASPPPTYEETQHFGKEKF